MDRLPSLFQARRPLTCAWKSITQLLPNGQCSLVLLFPWVLHCSQVNTVGCELEFCCTTLLDGFLATTSSQECCLWIASFTHCFSFPFVFFSFSLLPSFPFSFFPSFPPFFPSFSLLIFAPSAWTHTCCSSSSLISFTKRSVSPK